MDIDFSELYVEPYKILGMSHRPESSLQETTTEETSKATEDIGKDWNNIDNYSSFDQVWKKKFSPIFEMPVVKRLPKINENSILEQLFQDT